YKVPDLFGSLGNGIRGEVLIGSLAAGLAAYLSVRFLMRYFETRTLMPFAIFFLVEGVGCTIGVVLTGHTFCGSARTSRPGLVGGCPFRESCDALDDRRRPRPPTLPGCSHARGARRTPHYPTRLRLCREVRLELRALASSCRTPKRDRATGASHA